MPNQETFNIKNSELVSLEKSIAQDLQNHMWSPPPVPLGCFFLIPAPPVPEIFPSPFTSSLSSTQMAALDHFGNLSPKAVGWKERLRATRRGLNWKNFCLASYL